MRGAQAPLFGDEVDPAPVVGDELGRFYTPPPLARACLERVLLRAAIPGRGTVVEPSVGGGAFARAIRARFPSVHLVGVDADEAANGLDIVDESHVGDAVSWACWTHRKPPALIIGNPPFADAAEHVEALLGLRPFRLAFILPWDRYARSGWLELIEDCPVEGMRLRELHPIAHRPWPLHCREVGLYVWGPNEPVCGRVLGDAIRWRA